MEKPSVVIQHKEAYGLSGLLGLMALIMGILNFATGEMTVFEWLLPLLPIVLAVFFLFYAKCSEKIGEDGICIQTPFSKKQYAWHQIECVGIEAPSGKDMPKIVFAVTNCTVPVRMQYTKSVLSCVQYYYGEPDWDKYGKPPSVF